MARGITPSTVLLGEIGGACRCFCFCDVEGAVKFWEVVGGCAATRKMQAAISKLAIKYVFMLFAAG